MLLKDFIEHKFDYDLLKNYDKIVKYHFYRRNIAKQFPEKPDFTINEHDKKFNIAKFVNQAYEIQCNSIILDLFYHLNFSIFKIFDEKWISKKD